MSGSRARRASGPLPALLLSALFALLSVARGPAQVPAAGARADSTAPVAAVPVSPLPGFTRIQSRGPLVHRLEGGEPVTILTDSVLVESDSLTVRADTAFYYQERDTYDFRGGVRLTTVGSVVTCRRTVARRREDAADSEGDVRVEEGGVVGTAARGESRRGGAVMSLIGGAQLVSPEYTVWGDTIIRHRDTDLGEAFGHVRVLDPESQTTVAGDHATFRRGEKSAVVDRRPSLITQEPGKDPLAGRARWMRFQRDPQRVVMVDSVRIVEGRQEATADTAIVIGRERVLLRGSPVLRDGTRSTMRGRQIDLLYRDDKLDRVLLRGAARVEDTQPDSLARAYPGLAPLNVLEGDTMMVEIVDGSPQRTTVRGAAHSLYVPEDVSDEIATNDVKGDTMVIDFVRGRVDVVRVQGSMTGTYAFVRRDSLGARAAGAPDSARTPAGAALAPADTARATGGAPAKADSARAALPGRTGGFDFTKRRELVTYSGHAAVFRLGKRSIEITRDAKLAYGTLKLDARHVRFDTVHRELYADGAPLLEDSDQKIIGDRMGYNFGYRNGAVQDGVTSYDRSFYTGREIKRFADGTLKIRSGRMTSCDLTRPHYHFWAERMKIRVGDEVVASPVVLKIGEVPVFALPVYYKSLKRGRRSGILFPNFGFGWTSRSGRYIRDWGYYWATSDYLDFTFRGDYSEHQNLAVRLTNRYAKRYAYTGSLDWSRNTGLGAGPRVKEWQLNWTHNQEALFDVYTFRGDVRLASRTLTRNDLTSDVVRDVISGQRHSTVFVSRNWQSASGSLNLTRDEQVNATDTIPSTDNLISTTTLPQVNLSFRRRPVLSPLSPGVQGSLWGDLLRGAYFSHSYAASRTLTTHELTAQAVTSAKGNLSLEWRPPRLSIFNLSTGLQAAQSWQRTAVTGRAFARYDTIGGARVAVYDPVDLVRDLTQPALSVNSSAGATLYGLFPARLGALQAIRHTLSLTASHSFRPALGARQARSSVYGFSLGNRFDLKLKGDPAAAKAGSREPGETAGDEGGGRAAGARRAKDNFRKLDGVLDWQLNASYDPNAAGGRHWSSLSSGILIKPGQSRNLNFRLDNSVDLYARRIASTRFTYGLNLAGRLDTGAPPPPPEEKRSQAIDRLGAPVDTAGTRGPAEGMAPQPNADDDWADQFAGFQRHGAGGETKDPTEGGRLIPWTLSTSISYSSTNSGSGVNVSSARGNLSLTASPTRGWALNWAGSYDFERGLTLQNWGLRRDLHCWALEFTRMVSQGDQQFGFRIFLKTIPAVELKQGVGDLGSAAGVLSGGFLP